METKSREQRVKDAADELQRYVAGSRMTLLTWAANILDAADRQPGVRTEPDPMTEDQLRAVKTYLNPERALAPKTEEAIEAVLRAAAEWMAEGGDHWWVKMTVSADLNAKDKAEALQRGCDLLHPLVVEGCLGIHTVDATLRGQASDTGSEG